MSGKGGLDLILPELGRIDFGVMGEPTGMKMAVAERGLMVLDCTAYGKSGHAARNEGVNAIGLTGADLNLIMSVKRPVRPINFGYVADGTISEGMIPKLQNAFEAINSGVSRVVITSASALNAGTTIIADPETDD